MRWAITHRLQDLPRSKHTLTEGKTLEEDIPVSTDDFIGVYAKPESCEGTIDVCLACRINGLFRTQFMDKRNSAMLVRNDQVLDSLNCVHGNDLGAGWIGHHTDLLLLFALLYGMENLSDLPIVGRRRSKPCLNLRMV